MRKQGRSGNKNDWDKNGKRQLQRQVFKHHGAAAA